MADSAADRVRVFIGSSSEGLEVAGAIQVGLADVARCTLWNQGAFELGKSILENICDFVSEFDFAIFVASHDDETIFRGSAVSTVRDNVIFEMGLFIGALGRSRVIFVSEGDIVDFRFPSDLDGIVYATYDSVHASSDIFAALGPTCFRIRQHIKKASSINKLTRRGRADLTYAGALCFRLSDENILEFLLVTSTRDRIIFPKGTLIKRDESIASAASRIALREGGARGRVIEEFHTHIKYYNEESEILHRIEVFLMDVSNVITPDAEFRNPKWYAVGEAMTAITAERDYNTSYELARLLEWGEKSVGKYISRR